VFPFLRVSLWVRVEPKMQPKGSSRAWFTKRSLPIGDGKRLRGSLRSWLRSLLFCGLEGLSYA
jgi:hypothetical protein